MPGPRTRAKRQSEYGKRLSAKQAARNEYGLRERQFRRYFAIARQEPAGTGAMLLQLLERRLDNVVYRLDLSQTRRQARQWVSHGHITVNGQKMTIPSYQVLVNDEIRLTAPELTSARGTEPPAWLVPLEKQAAGKVVALPTREQIGTDIDEQLIVEFYSR